MNRIEKKEAVQVGEILKQMIVSSGMAASHNTRRIFQAWDNASGAGPYTLRKYFRDGKLYITLSSSVIRNQLSVNRGFILEKINLLLENDSLYIKDEKHTGRVREIVLK